MTTGSLSPSPAIVENACQVSIALAQAPSGWVGCASSFIVCVLLLFETGGRFFVVQVVVFAGLGLSHGPRCSVGVTVFVRTRPGSFVFSIAEPALPAPGSASRPR